MVNSYFVVSVQVNILAFFYVVSRRLLYSCQNQVLDGHKRSTCVVKPFPCEEVRKFRKEKHAEHIKARAIINSLASAMIFFFAMDIIFSTNIITFPFAGTNQKLHFGSLSLVSLCIFNLVLSLTTFRKIINLAHHFCRYTVALTILITSLYTNEIPLCVVIAMVTVGSVFSDELKELYNLKDIESRGETYSIFLLFHLIVNYFCQLLFPIMIIAFAMGNTKQNFFIIHPLSQTIFFLASAFMLWYSIWRLRRITVAYSNEKSILSARRFIDQVGTKTKCDGFTNINIMETDTLPIQPIKSIKPVETIKVIKAKDDLLEPSFTF